MAGRSGRRRVNANSPLVDLDLVFADDNLIDAIADRPWASRPGSFEGTRASMGGGRTNCALLTRDPLTELFESWRDELAADPLPAPPSARGALAVVEPRTVPRKGSMRPALAIAAAIAALLVGAACVGSKDATPDSALWTVTTVLWPNRAQSVESAQQVRAALDEARAALSDGRSRDAQLALLRAAVELGKIDEVDGRVDMQQQVATLWVATAPEDFAIDPEMSELITVARPALAVAPSPTATMPSQRPAQDASTSVANPSVPAPVPGQPAAGPFGVVSGGVVSGGGSASSSTGGLVPATANAPSLAAAVGTVPTAVSGSVPANTPGATSAQDVPTVTAGPSNPPSAPSTLPAPAPPTALPVAAPAEHAPAVEQSPPTPSPSAPTSQEKPTGSPGAGPLGMPAEGAAALPGTDTTGSSSSAVESASTDTVG